MTTVTPSNENGCMPFSLTSMIDSLLKAIFQSFPVLTPCMSGPRCRIARPAAVRSESIWPKYPTTPHMGKPSSVLRAACAARQSSSGGTQKGCPLLHPVLVEIQTIIEELLPRRTDLGAGPPAIRIRPDAV